jgi:hypothetical protein
MVSWIVDILPSTCIRLYADVRSLEMMERRKPVSDIEKSAQPEDEVHSATTAALSRNGLKC